MIDAQKVTGGNPEAIYFLKVWGDYLRHVDDTLDDNLFSGTRLCEVFALGCTVYASNFYRKQSNKLQMVILVGANLWMVANQWEKSPELWKKQHSDILRNTDVLMLNAVAQICVGFDTAAEASRALLAAGYANHISKYGRPETWSIPAGSSPPYKV